MDVQAVLLTGGRSQRMGADKARLLVDGVPLAVRVARELGSHGYALTVLGRQPLEGFGFAKDSEEFAGPLRALADFLPEAQFVFVCACDMPRFDARIVSVLRDLVFDRDAAVPTLSGEPQPLCSLYRSSAWEPLRVLVEAGERSVMRWLRTLNVIHVPEHELIRYRLRPECFASANTPEELAALLQ